MGKEDRRFILIVVFAFSQLTGPVLCWNTCLLQPGFISEWTPIEAQASDIHHKVTLEHGLASPFKVDIQVRPKASQPEPNFYFPGLGSSQRDDDVNSPYGGIVYVYNEEGVELFAPVKNDGYDAGTAIFTGGNAWFGPVQQSEKSVEVRVRVWGEEHFPAPDYESNWLPMDTNNNNYREVSHGLGQEPEYTLVKVKLPRGLFTEAVGSSAEIVGTLDWGGVIYAYNSATFKLWVPNNGKAGIFSNADGWGDDGKLFKAGEVKIYAWKTFNSLQKHSQKINLPSNSVMDLNQPLNRNDYLIDVKVKAIDGINKNFLFHASGAVQNVLTNSSMGGIVYSYSDRQFRFWYPKTGSLILVSSSWGSSNTQHSSKQVEVNVDIYQNYNKCPPITTTLVPPVTSTFIPRVTTTVAARTTLVPSVSTTVAPRTTLIPRVSSMVATVIKTSSLRRSTVGNTPVSKSSISRSTQTTNDRRIYHQTTLSPTTHLLNDTKKEQSEAKKKWFDFSFSKADVPTMLVGIGLGVAGSLLLFLLMRCIKHLINKGSENEVKPLRKRRDTSASYNF